LRKWKWIARVVLAELTTPPVNRRRGRVMDPSTATGTRVAQAIALLRSLLSDGDEAGDGATPWQEPLVPAPRTSGRLSATERLNWWFRPAGAGKEAWDNFFEDANVSPIPVSKRAAASSSAVLPPGVAVRDDEETLGPLADLRLVRAEPEEELFDADADAVVTCLYDFVHAIGSRDITAAMACVAPDYHTMEGDREVDYVGLGVQLKSILDGLRGWEVETSLVDIPEPVLYPGAILVYTHLQIEGYKHETRARQTIVHRRIAVFRQQSDHSWRLAALSMAPS
jgi:ketosteroid isomerase-like protein